MLPRPSPSKKFLFSLVALGCVVAAIAAEEVKSKQPEREPSSEGVSVQRGRYLVAITGCNDCHTPFKMGPSGPEPDMSRMLSGHPQNVKVTRPDGDPHADWVWAGNATNTAFAGPWGVTYAANLTPDTMSGIGIWTEQMFVNAIRRGKHWGEARPIMPPMPWQAFSNMTDDDLKSIYAYLRTIPPVSNAVPDYEPPPRPAHAK
jgi:mono/diheme cytochrome c family protein